MTYGLLFVTLFDEIFLENGVSFQETFENITNSDLNAIYDDFNDIIGFDKVTS